MATTRIRTRICSGNNMGWPKKPTDAAVNQFDRMVRSQHPHILGEQERWWSSQIPMFRERFRATQGYRTYAPDSVRGQYGVVFANRTDQWRALPGSNFRFKLHGVVWGVSGIRGYAGSVLEHRGTGRTATCAAAHITPSAFSNRFPEGSRRKRGAQKAWFSGMAILRQFAENQIRLNKRDYVIIMIDANASHDRVRQALGNTIAGKPVHIWTSPSGYEIDHIIVVGNASLVRGPWVIKNTPSDHDPVLVDVDLL